MAIPKKIIDLTELALQDRVLTFKEKETLIAEAVGMGVPQQEIDAYITTALTNRLQSYTKEELDSCPGCGHGVPLVADQCPYCGRYLEHQLRSANRPLNISGEAADIIRQENEDTEQEKHKNCPKCGAPYPLVSNICAHCGFVLHEQVDSVFNIKNMIANINQSIDRLKNNLRPTFWMVVKYRLNVIAVYFTVVFFIISVIFNNWFLCTLSMFLMPITVLILKHIHRDKEYHGLPDVSVWRYYLFVVQDQLSPVAKADMEFYDALHSYEKYQRQVFTVYGSNEEAKNLLADYANEIAVYKQLRDKNRNILAAIMLALMLVPVVIYFILR